MVKLFIFGSTGDLVKRTVLPALHNFSELEIYALGRKNLDNKKYEEEYCKNCSDKFKLHLNYVQIFFDENFYPQLQTILDKKKINYFYISMPPEFIFEILKKLIEIKNKGHKIRILIEKPFGINYEDAKKLKNLIAENKISRQVYLADHYLFKRALIKIKKKKFNNFKIVSIETVGLEGRSYYDSVGALKDMVQSHFLNILFQFFKFNIKDVEVEEYSRAQYKGYRDELGKTSDTETYARIKMKIKNRNIFFETGKKMKERKSFIEIDGDKSDLRAGANPYILLFDNFFAGKRKRFAKIKNVLSAWKLIRKIEEKKSELKFYE